MFLLAITLILGVMYFLEYRMKNSKTWKSYYSIPGPPTLPLIGHFQPFTYSLEKVFPTATEYALKFFPLYTLYPLHIRMVVLLHPDDIELVVSDMNHISKSFLYDFFHKWLGTGLLISTGKKWQQRRKILTPAFHFSILQQFIDIFNESTERLIEDIRNECHKSAVNVIPLITYFALETINKTAMGTQINVTPEEQEKYRKTVHLMSSIIAYRMKQPLLFSNLLYKLTPLSRKEDEATTFLHNFTGNVIQSRERKFFQQLTDDPQLQCYSTRKKLAMLDLLLKSKYDGAEIDLDGIREEVETFMFEGHDTVSTGICYMLMLLANLPDVQEEILREMNEILGKTNITPTYQHLQELKYTERVIKESLRLYPSVPGISRELGEDIVTKSGYLLRKGTTINVDIYNMHRHPNNYENPNQFDPDRFLPENVLKRHPFAYLPFSAGPRNCIGQKFAMLEIKALLCGVIRNFKLVAVDTPQDMKMAFDIILRSLKSINVKFVPRNKD